MLIEDVQSGFGNAGSDFYRCFLGTKYIAANADILPDPDFENGVVKIQSEQVHLMTDEERLACQALLLQSTSSDAEPASVELDTLSYEERLDRRKRRKTNPDGYRNSNFILGSAAEVERLWSIASHILTDERLRTTPLLFEAIIFLRVNERLWDVSVVKQAFHMAKSDAVKERLAQDTALGGSP